MGLFGSKKQKEEPIIEAIPESVVKNKLDSYRSNGNMIYNLLDDIDFDFILKRPDIFEAKVDVYEGSGAITRNGSEIVNDIRSQVEYLLNRLRGESSAELLKIQSEAIDASLIYFAETLNDALSKGNLVTAMACMMGLGYGIQQGHKSLPVSMTSQNDIRKELEKRSDKVRLYKDIVKLSVANDEYRKQIGSLIAQYNEIKKQFLGVHEQLVEQKKMRSDIYEKINNLTGRAAFDLGPEYHEAWELTSKHNNLYEQGQIRSTQISYFRQVIAVNDQQILSLRNAAVTRQYEIDPELDMQIREDLKTINLSMEKMQSDILTKQKALDQLFSDFKEIVSSREVLEAIYKETRRSNEIEHKLEAQKEAEREGEVRYKQYLKEEAEKEAKAIDEELKAEAELQKAEENVLKHKKKQTTSFN